MISISITRIILMIITTTINTSSMIDMMEKSMILTKIQIKELIRIFINIIHIKIIIILRI